MRSIVSCFLCLIVICAVAVLTTYAGDTSTISTNAPSVQTYVLDLAINSNIAIRVEPNKPFQVEIRNMMPKKAEYDLNQSLIKNAESPLSNPAEINLKGNHSEEKTEENTVKKALCEGRQALEQYKNDLDNAENERSVRSIVLQLESVDFSSCKDEQKKYERERDAVIQETRMVQSNLSVSEYSTMKIVIERKNPQHEKKAEWVFEFTTGDGNGWGVTTALLAMPDCDERLFLGKGSTDTTKIVKKEADEKWDAKLVPAMMYGWYSKPSRHGLQATLVGGVGLKEDNLALLIGGGINYRWNMTLMVGIGVMKREVRNGRYKLGQEVSSDVDEKSLVRSTFAPNAFIGLGYRFGESKATIQKGDKK